MPALIRQDFTSYGIFLSNCQKSLEDKLTETLLEEIEEERKAEDEE